MTNNLTEFDQINQVGPNRTEWIEVYKIRLSGPNKTEKDQSEQMDQIERK